MKNISYLLIFWSVSAFAYPWLHEGGHYIAFLLSGISSNQLKIGWAPFMPVEIEIIGAETPRMVLFAGGFIAAISFL